MALFKNLKIMNYIVYLKFLKGYFKRILNIIFKIFKMKALIFFKPISFPLKPLYPEVIINIIM